MIKYCPNCTNPLSDDAKLAQGVKRCTHCGGVYFQLECREPKPVDISEIKEKDNNRGIILISDSGLRNRGHATAIEALAKKHNIGIITDNTLNIEKELENIRQINGFKPRLIEQIAPLPILESNSLAPKLPITRKERRKKQRSKKNKKR